MVNALADRSAILQVHVDEFDLSLGQVGVLFENLQVSVRATASFLDQPPPYQSVRIGQLRLSSLDVVIDTLAWSSTLVLPVALQVLEIADYVTKGIILLQIGRHILGKLSKDMREKPLLAGVGPAYYEASDDFGPRRSDPSPREQQISELSREFDTDSNRVRAAVSAIEAIKRSTDIVAHSGGGVLSIPNRDDSIRIPGRIQARSS